MPTAEITVQYRNEKKPGKPMGSLKSSEGVFYGCPDNLLFQFTVGEVCTIEYSETPKKSGDGTWKTVTKKLSGASPAQKTQPQIRARVNPAEAEQMFVAALLKSFIEAGKLELSTAEIVAATNAIKDAYHRTLGSSEKQHSDDMDDGIPY